MIIPQFLGHRGFTLLEDRMYNNLSPKLRQASVNTLLLPVLLPVSALYGVKVQKYGMAMVSRLCTNASFSSNYSL